MKSVKPTTRNTNINRRTFIRSGALALFALGNRCAFRAPFDAPIPIPTKRVVVCSDIHIGYGEDGLDGEAWFANALSDLDNLCTIDYGFVLGDIAHNGLPEELQKYRSLREASTIPDWYELAGNHEYYTNNLAAFNTLVCPELTYMVRDGNVVWFVLSDELAGPEGNFSEKTIIWLIDMLSKNQDKIIIVCTHQCVYGTVRGSTNSIRYIYPKEMVAEILNRFRIDLWLCGHQHATPYSLDDTYSSGKTTFINVSSMHHAYYTELSQSVILDFNQGSNEIIAHRRSHDLHAFDNRFRVSIKVPFPIQLADRPVY